MMAATFVPIQSITLAASATSVTFSAIPQTFTDLVIRYSSRDEIASMDYAWYLIKLNGTSGTYTTRYIQAWGSGAGSYSVSSSTGWVSNSLDEGPLYTANTFSSGELTIPNYTGSAEKIASGFTVTENNATTSQIVVAASHSTITGAVTSIKFDLGGNIAAGSTFHLYGIKNS